jgi:hypothetical protein
MECSSPETTLATSLEQCNSIQQIQLSINAHAIDQERKEGAYTRETMVFIHKHWDQIAVLLNTHCGA